MLPNGEIVPSVTQILNAVIAKPGLQRWANQLGLNNKSLDNESKATLDTGKLLHAYIQADLEGAVVNEVGYTQEQIVLAKKSFAQYIRWKDGKQIKAIKTEYVIVSEKYKYGGTIDALLEIDGELTLLDWKTSTRISLDYKLQVVAYLYLLQEQNIIPSRVGVLKLPKSDGEFEYYEADANAHMQKYGEAWLKALEWYKYLSALQGE
jgi:ATP-dependent exoDNAse (exonuclease V) beta subunit